MAKRSPQIFTATWQNKPTYFIGIPDENGDPVIALWRFEGCKNRNVPRVHGWDKPERPDVRPIWTTRVSFAWHTPDLKTAQEALIVLLELEKWEKQYGSNPSIIIRHD